MILFCLLLVITLCREVFLATRNGSNVIREANVTEGQVGGDYLSSSTAPGQS